MTRNPIDSLTPKERECLRLVTADRKSAVIAGMLGIAVPTVETHLRSARAKLGGVSRFAAAQMLRDHEGHQSLTSQPMTIVERPDCPVAQPSDQPSTTGPQPLMMSDVRPAFDREDLAAPTSIPRENRNQLNTLNRIALVAFSLLALVVAGIAAIPLSDAVQDVARKLMAQRTS